MNINLTFADDGGYSGEVFARMVRHCLRGLVEANGVALESGILPPLYSSDVRYQEEPPDVESFIDGLTCYRRGHGDCAHLAAWRVAELQVQGEPADITIEFQPSQLRPGCMLYHVQVRRADGSVEDPSVILGMNQ